MRLERGFVFLSAEEMTGADRMAVEACGIDVLSLMENAGLRTAELARDMLGGVDGKEICCLIGVGNNGGDGLVAARHLHNWGGRVRVVLGGAKGEIRDVPAKQLAAVEKIGVEIVGPDWDFLQREDLLIDALLGYGSKGDPREPLATLIAKANKSAIMTLAVDVPSGLNATSGEPGNPCVDADATLTFGFPKTGFLNPKATAVLGDLYLADISFPPKVYRFYSQETGIFHRRPIVKMW